MKPFLFTIFMLGLSQAQVDLLDRYQWQNRIILLFADNAEHLLFQEQKEILAAYSEGLLERDLVIFEIFADTGFSPEGILDAEEVVWFRDYFGVLEGFSIVLIGKDGGIKRADNELVPTEDLFAQIDAMPMRIREMQEDN